MEALLTLTDKGLYCETGGFYVDPLRPVEKAVVTHAHGDHLRWGHQRYIVSSSSRLLARKRLSAEAKIDAYSFGKKFKMGKVWVSFHPAGHILGSAQVRIEGKNTVWVVSGDYKRDADSSCEPFETVPCDTFITEATFGLPIYHWRDPQEIAREMFDWWQLNAAEGVPSLLCCYALGKAQRITKLLRSLTDEPIFLHGAAYPLHEIYEKEGVELGPYKKVEGGKDFSRALILSPSSGFRSPWMRRFKGVRTAFASGWMAVRGNRKRQGYDRGFVLSDHADWEGLLSTCKETGANKIYVTHGQSEVFSRALQELEGMDASPLEGLQYGEELE